jgi:hypothetical protein
MKFTNCPYDKTPIVAECSRGSSVVSCPTCGAAWERHNSWLRRIREPDRNALRRTRPGAQVEGRQRK